MTGFNPSRPRHRWLLHVWLAVGIVISVRVAVQPEQHTVFPVFAGGAMHWWQDVPVYDDYRPVDFFRYPPTLAIAFTPFAWLGSIAGGILWAWLSLTVFSLGLHQFHRDLLGSDWSERRTAVFYALALTGAIPGLWNGQNNALLAGLLMLGVSAAVRERWWLAAFLLTGPVALKLSPLPLVLLFCALWPRQLAGRFPLALALGMLVPFLTRPTAVVLEQYRDWIEQLTQLANGRWPGFRDAWTVCMVLERSIAGETGVPDLRAPMDSSWYRLVQITSGIAVLAVCVWMRRRGRPSRELAALTFALGAGWLMLLGPAVEHPTFAFLAPVLAWAIAEPRRPGRFLAVAAGVLILLLGWSDLTRPLWSACPFLMLTLPLGTMSFLGWTVLAIGREPGFSKMDKTSAAMRVELIRVTVSSGITPQAAAATSELCGK
jgi:Glycosyltransferase family 87